MNVNAGCQLQARATVATFNSPTEARILRSQRSNWTRFGVKIDTSLSFQERSYSLCEPLNSVNLTLPNDKRAPAVAPEFGLRSPVPFRVAL